MKNFFIGLFALVSIMVLRQTALAGGTITFDKTQVYAPAYQAYLTCSCSTGEYKADFQNTDTTTALTLKGSGWSVGPLIPGQTGSYAFTDPGDYLYSVDGYPAVTGKITIVNQAPSFATGSKLSASDIGDSSLFLNWPKIDDDGIGGTYKVYKNSQEIRSDAATSMKAEGLDANMPYEFKVDGYDAAGLKTPTPLTLSVTTAKKEEPTTIDPSVSSNDQVTKENTLVKYIRSGQTNTLDETVVLSVNDILLVTGMAKANSALTLTLLSQPQVFTVATDNAGAWKQEIPLTKLEDGQHSLSAKSDVQTAEVELVSFTYLAAPIAQVDKQATISSLWGYWLVVTLGLALVIGFVGYWLYQRKLAKKLQKSNVITSSQPVDTETIV